MNKLTVRILSGIIALIFVFSILFLVMSISNDSKRGVETAKINFEGISLYSKNLCSFYKPDSPEFKEAMIIRLSQESKYYKIKISTDDKEIFSQFIPDAKSSFSSKEFSAEITTIDGYNLKITASYGTVTGENVFKSAKTSFILILIGTILSLSLLGVQSFITSKKDDDYEDALEKAEEIEVKITQIEKNNDISNKIEEKSESEINFKEPESSSYTNSSYSDDDYVPEDSISEISKADDDDIIELSDEEKAAFGDMEEEIETLEEQEETDSPYSNNEEKFENSEEMNEFAEVLGEELAKSSELNNDLSLVIVQSSDYMSSKPVFDNVKSKIEVQNEGKVLVYDYKNGFAMIMKKTNLDNALITGEELYAKMISILKESGIISRLSIGIASRTQRMLSSNRLIAEAEQAYEHGFEDMENNVVAFRVDPEAYKAFLRDQQ